jgi:hypothetical protein
MKDKLIIKHKDNSRGAQIFKKYGSHLKILGARRVTRCQFNTEDIQISGITIQNFVAMVSWHLGFVRPCAYIRFST